MYNTFISIEIDNTADWSVFTTFKAYKMTKEDNDKTIQHI